MNLFRFVLIMHCVMIALFMDGPSDVILGHDVDTMNIVVAFFIIILVLCFMLKCRFSAHYIFKHYLYCD